MIPGLYAAGDCTGGLLQISKAVSDGALTGTAAAAYLRQNGKNRNYSEWRKLRSFST